MAGVDMPKEACEHVGLIQKKEKDCIECFKCGKTWGKEYWTEPNGNQVVSNELYRFIYGGEEDEE